MRRLLRTWLLAGLLGASAAQAENFDGHQHDILELGGKCVRVEAIEQKEWNALKTVVSNGSLQVEHRYLMRGGLTSIGPGATLSVGPHARIATGSGDAAIRRFVTAPGAILRFEADEWLMDHTQIDLVEGASWYADIARLVLAGAMKDNYWKIAGKAMLVRGAQVAECRYGCEMKILLEQNGELWLGGRVEVPVELKGGKVVLFWDGCFASGMARVASGAVVTIEVAPKVQFDQKSIEVPSNAKLIVKRLKKMPSGLPERYPLCAEGDALNRAYYVSADAFASSIKVWTMRFPNPDSESGLKELTEEVKCGLFRKRFPAGKGPWMLHSRIVDVHGDVYETDLRVAKRAKIKGKPAPNEKVLVGQCGYDDALDLQEDILTNDLCNLYVGWHTAGKTLGEGLSEDLAAAWRQAVKEREYWSMSIYGGDSADLQARLKDLYGERYLGNNIGEYASYLYQSDDCRPKSIPNNRDLKASRNHLVGRYIRAVPTGWMGRFPYSFSTCGAALSCYELAGGIDFICNEQWAIGAQNLAHTTAEARGAARKWKPVYWCAWNAHEWQTTEIPYHTEQKYDSCYVGYLQEYVMGTSIIVLESGAQGTQAWKYTSAYPGQPKEERSSEGYDGEVARNYRAITKRFYEWVKQHPRDCGTPETKIAMALGNLDAYLGLNGDFTVWAQHANAATNSLWKYGAPERTQAALEDLFFPRSERVLEPYVNRWLAGTPFGQVDVMHVDDEATLKDLKRYDLLVFGGWNTMTEQQRDVLERYVKEGGTLVMSRPELSTRVDRDYLNYTDKDLMPLFGKLPPEGKAGEYLELKEGKGRYYLFTARAFPERNETYLELVRKLARGVRQTVTLVGDADTISAITYAVYPKKIYFLNIDTRHQRTFKWVKDGSISEMTLGPSEIREIAR